MKSDLFNWQEIQTNVEIPHKKGRVQLRLSQAAPLYVSAQGVEILQGHATAFAFTVSEAVTLRVEAPQGVRVFLYHQHVELFDGMQQESFTCIDRMPLQSEHLDEVTRALRLFKLEQNQILERVRSERDALEAARVAHSPPLIEAEDQQAPPDDQQTAN